MSQDRHEPMAPTTPPATPNLNEFNAGDASYGGYVPPPATMPDEYWQQAATAQVKSRSNDTSTVPCWAFVGLGLLLPIFALLAALWALWMSREDSRFIAPAAVGFGIFALPFLML